MLVLCHHLPSTHLVSKQWIENQIPFHISPMWIRARFLHQLSEDRLQEECGVKGLTLVCASKDVWVRRGCITGLGDEYDTIIAKERRYVKAFPALRNARVYIAGVELFGGRLALQPLMDEFPYVATKETLARGESSLHTSTGLLTTLRLSAAMCSCPQEPELSSIVVCGEAAQVLNEQHTHIYV
ncbi:O-fucosyltransferase 37 [Salvia divinorum]|uniref:O-fucosyltransferase 37 n=1 Tax=Salvia divinorum TaxID=28513 RepID=A0ABD1GCI4_SALDI